MVQIKINRILFNKLYSEISEPHVSILLGARQVGKTTLLRQLENAARSAGRTTAFFNLELSADLERLAGNSRQVLQTLLAAGEVIFIDEFHYLENASKVFKAIYDSGAPVKIYASGSSSIEIHKHLKESLAGRFRKTLVHPLSWPEYQQVSHATWAHYCQWGGMPGLLHVATDDQRAELLDNIVSTYLTKDIKGLIQEENVRAFNSLLYALAQNQGALVVVANLAREVGLTEPTIARHLDIMHHTYVCSAVPSFSRNLANELKKSRKYYLYDLGIRNALLKDFRAPHGRDDGGVLAETFVFLHLMHQLKPNMEIRFWRTKKGDEVDFIILKNRIPYPVEVKLHLADRSVPSGLRRFMTHYKTAPFGMVLNESVTGTVDCAGRPVYFRPLSQAADMECMRNVV